MKKQVLVYRLSALGDVAMSIPAVYSTARAYPGCTFHVFTSAFCTQLYVDAPANVKVHAVESPVRTLPLLRRLSGLSVDMVADLHNVGRSWLVDLLFLLRGKRVRMLHKNRSERKAILTRHQATAMPFTQRYFDVFARLGLPSAPTFHTLFSQLPPLPAGLSKGDDRWIGIAPFARYANKTYPPRLMSQVAQLLAEQPGTRVLLFGSRGEQAATLRQWETLSPRIQSVAGLYSLRDELSLMARLDAMLSMDSANMHMASLVGTRVFSVWGSTTPACGFMGWQQQADDAILLGLPCQPCSVGGSPQCPKQTCECLEQLAPQVVASRLLAALS